MKILLTIVLVSTLHVANAQIDSIPGGVYFFNKTTTKKVSNGQQRNFFNGSSKDLTNLEVHSLTLQPGQFATGDELKTNLEKLIIVKDGTLTVTIKDTTKDLGPASYAVIIAGDKHGFKNNSKQPLTYYSLIYTARAPVNIERGHIAGGSFYKDWKDMVVKQTDKGESRQIYDRPTSMFSRFDMHATALNPGIASHDAHRHRAEEIILMIKGNVEVQLGQQFIQSGPGDVIFYPSYSLHAVKNTGKEQCGYFAIQWRNE